MAALAPLQLLDEERRVLSLDHIIEETEILPSGWHWTADFSDVVPGRHLAEACQHIYCDPIVPSPALKALLHNNVGLRLFCDCPRPFHRIAGHKLTDIELSFVNRLPDL